MVKLPKSALEKLTKDELVEYTEAVQEDTTAAGWNATHYIAVLAAFVVGFLLSNVSVDGGLLTRGKESPKATPRPSAGQAGNDQAPNQAKADVEVGTLPVKGDENAPVTIIEFSDFECPFCKRFFDDTLAQIEKEYIETGQVKFYYRDFPLTSLHPQAETAAMAARCANEQDAFWAYHDTIFENQGKLGDELYTDWALDLGLDIDQFEECLDSEKFADAVDKDSKDGSAAGVNGTPAFFINGQLVSGAQPFQNFKRVINQALEESS